MAWLGPGGLGDLASDLKEKTELEPENFEIEKIGAKYLFFFSSHSLKTREKYISFAQFVYFLREVGLLSIFEW